MTLAPSRTIAADVIRQCDGGGEAKATAIDSDHFNGLRHRPVDHPKARDIWSVCESERRLRPPLNLWEIRMFNYFHVAAPLDISRAFLVGLAVLACGCGAAGSGSSQTPTSPTVSVTPRSLSLSRSSLEVLVGDSETVTAAVSYSDGSLRSVAPTWSSSNSSVVSVDQGGVIRGVSAGVTSVTASSSGLSSSLVVRSIPNYSGRWYGQYRIVSCSAPFRWGNSYCTSFVGTGGTIFYLDLNLEMSGTRVNGSWRRGSFQGSVSGTVSDNGALVLQGSESASRTGSVYSFQIRNWLTSIRGSSMVGRWDSIGSLSGETQTALQEYEMVSVSRQ